MSHDSNRLRPDHRLVPELLAPAGSPEALEAAFLAGADAVYLGGSRFNARINAHNFGPTELREAVTHAHRMGGRVYLTLNTLVWDREISDALEAAYEAAVAGVDALIIADMGAAALIHRALPTLPLHASTQLSGHSAAMGQVLSGLGFSRFVIARETCLEDLEHAVAANPLEVEVFIHGALCVSHSGQCLFSSVVGGRSGNRGECAQPCRLPYGCADCGKAVTASPPRRDKKGSGPRSPRPETENYPLSLKDLSLAGHVPALISAGVSSLKIEGRMKSPGYVSGVTSIWRRLLDENRAATPQEITALEDLFTRGGFTDGYQTRRVSHTMMGIRSEADKERTAKAEKAALSEKHPARLPLELTFTAKAGTAVTLTAEAPLYRSGGIDPATGVTGRPDTVAVTVTGDVPTPAENPAAALTPPTVLKQLTRTGGTPYAIPSVVTRMEEGLMLPLSRLNALRREALEALDAARVAAMPDPAGDYRPLSPADLIQDMAAEAPASGQENQEYPPADARTEEPKPHSAAPEEAPRIAASQAPATPPRTARFHTPDQITPAAVAYFDLLYLPLGRPHPEALPQAKRGVLLPPVIFDREAEAIREALTAALRGGIRHILVGNPGHLPLIRAAEEACGLSPGDIRLHGDLRLNVANTPAALRYRSLGLQGLLLSPELTLPRMRDIAAAAEGMGAVIYGRLPLMLLEKCAIREVYRHMKPEEVCRRICARDAARMRDRMGKDFPLLRDPSPLRDSHRNILCNSLPTGMSDRMEELERARLWEHHFLFTVESPAEVDGVIAAYRNRRPLPGEVRRMVK